MERVSMPYPSSRTWTTHEGGYHALSFDKDDPRYLTYSWDHCCNEEDEELGLLVDKSFKGVDSMLFKFYGGTETHFHEKLGVWFFKVHFSGLDSLSIPVDNEDYVSKLKQLVREWESINNASTSTWIRESFGGSGRFVREVERRA